MQDQFPYYYDPQKDQDANAKANQEIIKYAGIYLLKMMEAEPPPFQVPLSSQDESLEPILDDLLFRELILIDPEKSAYQISQKGVEYVDSLIDEIEGYIDEYQDFEPATRVNLMKRDHVNPLRARFLWGLYDGEFDDLVEWQDQSQFSPSEIKINWRQIITSKEFYDYLFEDIIYVENIQDDSLDQVSRDPQHKHQKINDSNHRYPDQRYDLS